MIGSESVWDQKWRILPGERLRLPHPSHRDQIHEFDICEIGLPAAPVRFAVAELSNGVFGFYTEVQYLVLSGGVLGCGGLRYEVRQGEEVEGRPDATSPWVVILDMATKAIVLDCGAWDSSEAELSAVGILWLRLRQSWIEHLIRIDGEARMFADWGTDRELRPLADLAVTVEALRLVDHRIVDPHKRWIAPDASMRVDTIPTEWRNGGWVDGPKVIEIATGRVLINLWGTDWNALPNFPNANGACLRMSRFGKGGEVTLDLDIATDRFNIVIAGHPQLSRSGRLEEVEVTLMDAIRRFDLVASGHEWR